MFKLTEEIRNQIMFHIENQNDIFRIRKDTGQIETMDCVRQKSSEEVAVEYIHLPRWTPVDGFQLMEGFVDTLKNPVFRERFREVLASRKGVFRKFKDIVNERNDIKNLWFQYKERRMRVLIGDWYATLCEVEGLEAIEGNFEEEIETPVLVDFSLVSGEDFLPLLSEWDRSAFAEQLPENRASLAEYLYLRQRSGISMDSDSAVLLAAINPEGAPVGFCWCNDARMQDNSMVCEVIQLYVLPEYRGVGLAREMIGKALSEAFNRGIDFLIVHLPEEAAFMNRLLEREEFTPLSTLQVKKIDSVF